MTEDEIYQEIRGYAEEFVVRQGGELRSRQIDAVLRAVAKFLAPQPNIMEPEVLRALEAARKGEP